MSAVAMFLAQFLDPVRAVVAFMFAWVAAKLFDQMRALITLAFFVPAALFGQFFMILILPMPVTDLSALSGILASYAQALMFWFIFRWWK